jgi:hypothetical protein
MDTTGAVRPVRWTPPVVRSGSKPTGMDRGIAREGLAHPRGAPSGATPRQCRCPRPDGAGPCGVHSRHPPDRAQRPQWTPHRTAAVCAADRRSTVAARLQERLAGAASAAWAPPAAPGAGDLPGEPSAHLGAGKPAVSGRWRPAGCRPGGRGGPAGNRSRPAGGRAGVHGGVGRRVLGPDRVHVGGLGLVGVQLAQHPVNGDAHQGRSATATSRPPSTCPVGSSSPPRLLSRASMPPSRRVASRRSLAPPAVTRTYALAPITAP